VKRAARAPGLSYSVHVLLWRRFAWVGVLLVTAGLVCAAVQFYVRQPDMRGMGD